MGVRFFIPLKFTMVALGQNDSKVKTGVRLFVVAIWSYDTTESLKGDLTFGYLSSLSGIAG